MKCQAFPSKPDPAVLVRLAGVVCAGVATGDELAVIVLRLECGCWIRWERDAEKDGAAGTATSRAYTCSEVVTPHPVP